MKYEIISFIFIWTMGLSSLVYWVIFMIKLYNNENL